MSKSLRCGCRITPGGPISYGMLRVHITEHIHDGFLDLTERLFMMELLRGLNPGSDPEQKFYLGAYVPFRDQVMQLNTDYEEIIKPGLEKIWPKNPIAEALL